MTHRHQRDAVAGGLVHRPHLVVEAVTKTVAVLLVCSTVVAGTNIDVARSIADPSSQPIIVDFNTLDPAVQVFLDGRRAKGMSGLVVDDDVEATRAHEQADPKRLAHPRVQVATTDLTIPGPAGVIRARHYVPPGAEPRPLLVFYHGGGLVYGDLDLYDDIVRQICHDARVHVLSIDYRLAPEHKAPAAVDDAYAAFLWAAAHATDLGALPGRVAVGGDSAGGTLAAVVSQMARGGDGPLPTLQWLIYPLTDVDAQTRSRTLFANGFLLSAHDIDWFDRQYLDGSNIASSDPRVSPLETPDLSGLPPALVITAGFDPLRDEGRQYAVAMQAAGVPVELHEMSTLTHGFLNLGSLGGESKDAVAAAISELRVWLNHG
jgi:acetyl esterase/lipase